MKDSGVEWIGEIPDDWTVRRLKQITRCKDGERIPVDKALRKNGEYPYWGAGSITDYIDSYLFDEELVLLGEDGAPFFDRMRDVAHYVNYKCWINNHIHVLQTKKNEIDSQYLTHFLNIVDYRSNINGSILNKLTQSNMGEINVCFPTYNQQVKIVHYINDIIINLDFIKISALNFIDKLKEYRQSIITEAVTKGLHDVAMKDSGIEWIGEIPAHWYILAFRYILSERNEKNIPIKTDNRLSLSIDKGVTLYAEKTTNLDRFKDDVSGYKLTHVGDLVLNSMNMIVGAVGVTNYYGCVSPAYYTYYDNESDHCTAKYCDYIFKSKTIRKVLYSLGKGILSIDRGDDKINTCRLKVSREDLRSLKLPIPSIDEQREIINYLDKKCAAIDKLIADKEQVIDKLEEYKKSLIYECVTGKREVPA